MEPWYTVCGAVCGVGGLWGRGLWGRVFILHFA
jgi:hypothetical protein